MRRTPVSESDTRHGTYAGYKAGCRQPCCMRARRAYSRRRIARQKAVGLPANDSRHGTGLGYVEWSCRCVDCRDAIRALMSGLTCAGARYARLKRDCDLCGQVFRSHERHDVDHDHDTGRVRGVVHVRCNRLISVADCWSEVVVPVGRLNAYLSAPPFPQQFLAGPRITKAAKPRKRPGVPPKSRERNLRNIYGLSVREIEWLDDLDVCPICATALIDVLSHIDHCSVSGIVRGKVCNNCNNRLLPAVERRPDLFRVGGALASYLFDPPLQQFRCLLPKHQRGKRTVIAALIRPPGRHGMHLAYVAERATS